MAARAPALTHTAFPSSELQVMFLIAQQALSSFVDLNWRLFRLGSRLSVAVPLDPMTLFSAGHGAGFTTCSLVVGWREEGVD